MWMRRWARCARRSIDADVALSRRQGFHRQRVRPRAIGSTEVIQLRHARAAGRPRSCMTTLVEGTLGAENAALNLGSPPAPDFDGSISARLKARRRHRGQARPRAADAREEAVTCSLASLDCAASPAAMEQLKILGDAGGLSPRLPIVANQMPVDDLRGVRSRLRVSAVTTCFILDTAGRQQIIDEG